MAFKLADKRNNSDQHFGSGITSGRKNPKKRNISVGGESDQKVREKTGRAHACIAREGLDRL